MDISAPWTAADSCGGSSGGGEAPASSHTRENAMKQQHQQAAGNRNARPNESHGEGRQQQQQQHHDVYLHKSETTENSQQHQYANMQSLSQHHHHGGGGSDASSLQKQKQKHQAQRQSQSQSQSQNSQTEQQQQQQQQPSRAVLQSCQFCRRRKIRCDKTVGGCTQCLRAKTECVYPASQRKGRPRKAGTKPGRPAATPREEQLLKKIWQLENVIGNLTGGGGRQGSAAQSVDQNGEQPLTDQLDRLVVGKSYVNDTFWADYAKEVPEDSDDESFFEDGEEKDYSLVPVTPEIYHSNFIFGVNLATEDLSPLHPPLPHIPLYWEIYLENCEMVLSVFHKPTTYRIVKQAQQDVTSLSKAHELLMFSVYFATINSMPAEEVSRKFGADRRVLLPHYENAVQHALARVGFLNTKDLLVLQAFVLYLICIRHVDGAVVWAMTGLAIRLAQGMNLDRDGEPFHLSPLHTEIRRRMWHQISLLDMRASEAKGCFPTTLFYNTKLPLNINDDDLTAEMREPPISRDGITEMTIPLLRYETCEIGRKLRMPSLTLDGKEQMIKYFREHLEVKYLRYCRAKGGLYDLSNAIANVVTSRMLLMIHKRRSEEQSEEVGARDQLFQTSTELLEFSYQSFKHPDGMKWNWLFRAHVQWHAVNTVLSEILARPRSAATQRAWNIIDVTSPTWEVPQDRANRLIYNSVIKALAQAQEYRGTQEPPQHDPHQPQQQQPQQHPQHSLHEQYIDSRPRPQPQTQDQQHQLHDTHSQHTSSERPNLDFMRHPPSGPNNGYNPSYENVPHPGPPLPSHAPYHVQPISPRLHSPRHRDIFVNQGTGLLDDQIGVGVGVNVTNPPEVALARSQMHSHSQTHPQQQSGWYVAQSGPHGQHGPLPPHPPQTMSLEEQQMVYGGHGGVWVEEYNHGYGMGGGMG